MLNSLLQDPSWTCLSPDGALASSAAPLCPPGKLDSGAGLCDQEGCLLPRGCRRVAWSQTIAERASFPAFLPLANYSQDERQCQCGQRGPVLPVLTPHGARHCHALGLSPGHVHRVMETGVPWGLPSAAGKAPAPFSGRQLLIQLYTPLRVLWTGLGFRFSSRGHWPVPLGAQGTIYGDICTWSASTSRHAAAEHMGRDGLSPGVQTPSWCSVSGNCT